MFTSKKRFDLFELLLISAVSAFVAWSLKPTYILADPAGEMAPFRAAYGPDRNSEGFEEWLIRDFYQDRRDGVFVDVGANHHQQASNTYYLERSLGWSGIAVEPLTQFEAGYREHRPRTRFRAFFVSDQSDQRAKIYVGDETLVTSQTREFTARWGGQLKEIEAPTITLTALLTKEGIERIDFLNMDIELAEPKALAGFDIRRFTPSLVCIEAHPEVRQEIISYFHTNGYVMVGKYLRADQRNLYFTPASA